MRIDDFMLIFKVIFILEVLKIVKLPCCLYCVLFLFSLICDDRIFTQEQMISQVIEFLNERLEDENIYFILNIFF